MDALRSVYQSLERGQWADARSQCSDILSREGDVAALHHAIGLSFCGEAAFTLAVPHVARAWQLDPVNPRWARDLGALYARTGRWTDAYDVFAPVLEALDADAVALFLTAAVEIGRADLALARVAQRPGPAPSTNLQYLSAYGIALANVKRYEEAEAALQECLARDPDMAPAHEALAFVYEHTQEAERSLWHARARARLSPSSAHARMRLALACSERGLIDESRCERDAAASLGVTRAEDHSAHIFMMLSDPQQTGDSILAASRRAFDGVPPGRPMARRRGRTARRLRVGYVSGECRSTPAFYFFSPFLRRHDRSSFEIFLYSSSPLRDHFTEAYKEWPEHWRDCADVAKVALADTIRRDALDVVVDLSGHFIFNTLWTLADRVAPVQATYPNYPGTTGCPHIDYFFTDQWTSPSGTDGEYSEALYRLPCGYLMYEPAVNVPPLGPLPMDAAGYPTFGIFQRLSKFNEDVWDALALVLSRTSNARLLIQNGDRELDRPESDTSRMIGQKFASRGIDPARVTLKGGLPHFEHMAMVGQVDVALDTFPYNGQTTTCESLWMGVPVVTLPQRSHVSRVCAALLTRLGHPEWVADSVESYAEIATSLASDASALARTRRQLRHDVAAGGLMNGAGLARALETAYREFAR